MVLDVAHVAKVAGIKLSQKELDELSIQLDEILQWASQLDSLNIHEKKVEKKFADLRDDNSIKSSNADEIISQFPRKNGRKLQVPRSL